MSRMVMCAGAFLCLASELVAQDATLIKAVDTSLDGTQPGRVDVKGDVYYLRPALVVQDGNTTVVAGTISHRRQVNHFAQLYYLIVKRKNGTIEHKLGFVEGSNRDWVGIANDVKKGFELVFLGGKEVPKGDWKKDYPTWLTNAETIAKVYVERVKTRDDLAELKPSKLKSSDRVKPSAKLKNAVDTALAGSQPDRIDVGGDVYYLRPALTFGKEDSSSEEEDDSETVDEEVESDSADDGNSTFVGGIISHRRKSKNYHQTWYLIVVRDGKLHRFDSRYEDQDVMHFKSKLNDRSYARVEQNAQTIVETFAAQSEDPRRRVTSKA